MAYIKTSFNKILLVMCMYKRKNASNNVDKKIEIVNIYEDNNKNFEDILTEAIKNIRIKSKWLSNTKKDKKGDF